MRLIHVKTQEQYNSWMQKLKDEGYVWNGGNAPINIDEIDEPDASFVIELEIDDKTLSYGYRGYYTKDHHDTEIEDHKANDMVNHPSHYRGLKGLEVREVMENFVPKYDRYGGLVSCDIKDAIKYILRAPDKNGLEDLKKAKRMIKYVIDNWEDEIK